MNSPFNSPLWNALEEHYKSISQLHLRDLFHSDPQRFTKFSICWNEFLFDYSKNRLTEKTLSLLFQLANEINLSENIEKMFSGQKINFTENRSVLHIALRNRSGQPIYVDGRNVMDEVKKVLEKMKNFSLDIRSQQWRGYSGKPIKYIVNIGIGGSDLGPRMVCRALTPYGHKEIKVHFVSNIDGTDLAEVLKAVELDQTLFIVSSKTFTTKETLTNAQTARKKLIEYFGGETKAVEKHFVAVSTNEKAVKDFGINPINMFEFWDWVGGRFSLWSAIGLSIVLYIGMENFEELLYGAYLADEHFRNTPFEKNIPVIMALLGFWYGNFFGAETYGIFPYDQYLELLPNYLQQLYMESNGKRINKEGKLIHYQTGPILWGNPGTNGQHSFFQLLHQGTHLVPSDFIAPIETHNPLDNHHLILLSNFFAQTEALMKGKTEEEVKEEMEKANLSADEIKRLLPHRSFPGNRPSNSILITKITPKTLGSLIAFYEHSIFVQGLLWNINSFDQWGVELGKQLATKIEKELASGSLVSEHDCSTKGLIEHYLRESRVKF
ncbi:glucose-6-phosphate isomerase [Methylacidiphilum caldifontis]|uniref:glucose-6-phosphate isomerase n=1 Tax=Methylacidiphilum caldifontis TaxID=2795386 RepID=UPI001A901863|nr:glucose-6-phosphate isomerase [Methylacidiphilum caldifontis]QSR89018.1 glucose-6-phosphate isomerase [Methylacidiphilum caldifontis]